MITTEQILKVMEDKGYPVFRNSKKNYNLNLIGIRTTDNESNKFNDLLVVMWFWGGEWNRLNFSITTDPGVYYRKNPMNVNGTAILAEGHHGGIWEIGKHLGRYKALVQRGLATVYRDNDKDHILDMVVGTEEEGYFGINCHRSNEGAKSMQVGRWSAGCQVFANPIQFDSFMQFCDRARDNWGNKFSYTLLLEDWFNETQTV